MLTHCNSKLKYVVVFNAINVAYFLLVYSGKLKDMLVHFGLKLNE